MPLRAIVRESARPDRPVVLVQTWRSVTLRHALVAEAADAGWDLHDLDLTEGALPTRAPPAGAIVENASGAWFRAVRKAGRPVVRIGVGAGAPGDHVPTVLLDPGAAGRLAAEHLAGRGFRQVGYVGEPGGELRRPLHEAFLSRAAELGCTCHLFQFRTSGERRSVSPAARFERRTREIGPWLTDLPKPVGLLTYSDWMAGRLCVMCRGTGLAVPEHVSVLGYGNDPYGCEAAPVELSSVDPDEAALGREAARLLSRLMRGEAPPPAPVLVPPRGVVVRRSTDVLAVPDPLVAGAVRYLWEHFAESLSVEAVARRAGVSRRKLERAFRARLGRTVNAELLRKRLEELCGLLRSTDTPVMDLAPLVGFPSVEHLHRCFRKAYGISPRTYRQQQARSA